MDYPSWISLCYAHYVLPGLPGCPQSPEAGSEHLLYYKVTEWKKLYAERREGECVLDREHSMSKEAVGISTALNAGTVLDTEND